MEEEITKVVSKGKAAGVLRFVFHDAGTFQLDDNSGGMNGSVIYELDRAENKGLKTPFKILEKAKNAVDAMQPVSWADMIAVAGAEAVSVCGGPTIQVALGRLDSKEPDPEGKLPEETLDAEWTGQQTLPNVFVGGNHIGDCDTTWDFHSEGKLVPLLTEAGVVAKLQELEIS